MSIIDTKPYQVTRNLADNPTFRQKICRLGTAGETLHLFASGIDDRQVLPPGEAKSISRETTFGEDTRDHSFLEATLWVQSEKVGADLREKGKQARCVTLRACHEINILS